MREMTRRTMFGGMSLMGLLVFTTTLWGRLKSGKWPTDDGCYPAGGTTPGKPLRYKGFTLFWSGWIPSMYTAKMVGTWNAWPVGKEAWRLKLPYMYAACPGGDGPYEPGDCWDLALKPLQQVIEKATPDHVKLAHEREGLRRLIRLIDSRDWRGYRDKPLVKQGTGIRGIQEDGGFRYEWSGWQPSPVWKDQLVSEWQAWWPDKPRSMLPFCPSFLAFVPKDASAKLQDHAMRDSYERLANVARYCIDAATSFQKFYDNEKA